LNNSKDKVPSEAKCEGKPILTDITDGLLKSNWKEVYCEKSRTNIEKKPIQTESTKKNDTDGLLKSNWDEDDWESTGKVSGIGFYNRKAAITTPRHQSSVWIKQQDSKKSFLREKGNPCREIDRTKRTEQVVTVELSPETEPDQFPETAPSPEIMEDNNPVHEIDDQPCRTESKEKEPEEEPEPEDPLNKLAWNRLRRVRERKRKMEDESELSQKLKELEQKYNGDLRNIKYFNAQARILAQYSAPNSQEKAYNEYDDLLAREVALNKRHGRTEDEERGVEVLACNPKYNAERERERQRRTESNQFRQEKKDLFEEPFKKQNEKPPERPPGPPKKPPRKPTKFNWLFDPVYIIEGIKGKRIEEAINTYGIEIVEEEENRIYNEAQFTVLEEDKSKLDGHHIIPSVEEYIPGEHDFLSGIVSDMIRTKRSKVCFCDEGRKEAGINVPSRSLLTIYDLPSDHLNEFNIEPDDFGDDILSRRKEDAKVHSNTDSFNNQEKDVEELIDLDADLEQLLAREEKINQTHSQLNSEDKDKDETREDNGNLQSTVTAPETNEDEQTSELKSNSKPEEEDEQTADTTQLKNPSEPWAGLVTSDRPWLSKFKVRKAVHDEKCAKDKEEDKVDEEVRITNKTTIEMIDD